MNKTIYRYYAKNISSLCLFCITILISLSTSCGDSSGFRKIPVPSVRLRIYPFGMDNVLGPIGNYKIFPNDGYAGIIVYHFTETEYLAYDLACPNDYEHGHRVTYDPGRLTLQDKNGCGTVFSIITGFPEIGYTNNPLHIYNTLYNPQNQTLTIYN